MISQVLINRQSPRCVLATVTDEDSLFHLINVLHELLLIFEPLEQLANDILGIIQLDSLTNIGAGIAVGETLLSDSFNGNQVIDVSTDGRQNQGDVSPVDAAKRAVDDGNADRVNVIAYLKQFQ